MHSAKTVTFFLLAPLIPARLLADPQTNLPASRHYDEIKIEGRIFTNITIKALTPGDGMLAFDGGGIKILFSQLPEPARSHFYDSNAAAAFYRDQNRRAEHAAFTRAEAARQLRIEFLNLYKPLRIIDGILFDFTDDISRFRNGDGKITENMIAGTVTQVTDEGLLFEMTSGAAVFVKHYRAAGQVIDGSRLKIVCLPMGRYQFTTVMGATRTLPLFDCGRVYDGESGFTNKVVLIGTSMQLRPIDSTDQLQRKE